MKQFVFLLTLPLTAQIANVSVAGVTNTQAVLQYTAPDALACTVAVSTSPTLSPLVHDVDPSIFAGSNLDNRAGSISSGPSRTFVAGTRDAEQGLNGHWYSRALQALTAHYYQISCGSFTASGSFITSNIALGNTYLDPVPAAASAAGGAWTYTGQYAYPEFLKWDALDSTARQEVVIDPHTGMALKRMTMPQDGSAGGFDRDFVSVSGANWTASDAGTLTHATTTSDSIYATASTSDWLVLSDPTLVLNIADGAKLESLTVSVKGWCSTSNNCAELCLSVDGVSCWPTNTNVYPLTLGTTPFPAAFATYGNGSASMFPWTPPGPAPLISSDLTKRSGPVNIDASGNVSWVSSAYPSLFYPGWIPGTPITIAGVTCRLAAYTNPQAMRIDPASCPSLSLPLNNAPYSAGGLTVMIRRKPTSSGTLYIEYSKYTRGATYQLQWPSGGGTKTCSEAPKTNSVTGHSGYLCVVGNTPQAYWIDASTGDANWLTSLTVGNHSAPDGWTNTGCNVSSVTFLGTAPISPEAFYCPAQDEHSKYIVLSCTLTSTWQAGNGSVACSNLTPGSIGKDLLSLIRDFTAGQASVFDPILFNQAGFIAFQNGKILGNSRRSYQDTTAWIWVFNPTLVSSAAGCVGGGAPGCIVAAQNTWSAAPARWSAYHGSGYIGEADIASIAATEIGHNPGVPGGNFYSVTVTSGVLGSAPSIAAGTNGCPAGTLGCDLVGVDGEPCILTPSGPGGGSPAEPLNCPKNSAQSWLQDAAVGDVFGTQTGGGVEFLKLISKSGSPWNTALLQRGYGRPELMTAHTIPVTMAEMSLARTDSFCCSPGLLASSTWNWDYAKDPHGLNANGTTVVVSYAYQHAFSNLTSGSGLWVGDGPSFDDNMPANTGYGIYSGPSLPIGAYTPTSYGTLGPTFAGKFGLSRFNQIVQDHASPGPAGTTTFLDGRTVSGPGPTAADVATNVAGQLYKFGAVTSDGDNLTFIGGGQSDATSAINRKSLPTAAWCGTQPLIDISSSTMGDAISGLKSDSYKYCIARKAGECRTGSARGDIYMNCPVVNPRYNYSNTYGCNNIFTENGLGSDLCVGNSSAYSNAVTQVGYDRTDTMGALGRSLTRALIRNRLNNVNMSVRVTPDGGWLLFEGEDFPGSEYQILSGQMTPVPPVDSINRTTFVPMNFQLNPPNGVGVDNAIIRFGYAENGAADQFYCTSRHETCLAAAGTVPAIPFQFPSDSPDGTLTGLTGMACASGCSVMIPSLSQRVVYYQVLYRDSGNSVVAQTGIQAAPTP